MSPDDADVFGDYVRDMIAWFDKDAADQSPIEEKIKKNGGCHPRINKKHDCPNCNGPMAPAVMYDCLVCVLCGRVLTGEEMMSTGG